MSKTVTTKRRTRGFLYITQLVSVMTVVIFISACKKTSEETVPFDKASLLTNVADHLILPAIHDFQMKMEQLETEYLQFQSEKTSPNLENVRAHWKNAYLSWQTLKLYDFGPLRDLGFKGATGVFPSDTVKIEANIANGTTELASAANTDAIGLHALDYLLYRENALDYLSGGNGCTNYGLAIIQKISNEIRLVSDQWASYRATFIASTGTESTSAFSLLVNEFNRDYELAKNAKLGIPIGKQSLGIQLPEYIEVRKSGFSLDVLRKNMEALRNLYNGVSLDGMTNGQGFDDYLSHLDRAALNISIQTNFEAILAKIDSFDGSLEEEMQSNAAEMDELYTLLQGQVVSLKTDMTSAFGVLITYQDNDGD